MHHYLVLHEVVGKSVQIFALHENAVEAKRRAHGQPGGRVGRGAVQQVH